MRWRQQTYEAHLMTSIHRVFFIHGLFQNFEIDLFHQICDNRKVGGVTVFFEIDKVTIGTIKITRRLVGIGQVAAS